MARPKASLPLLVLPEDLLRDHAARVWLRRLADDPMFQRVWIALRNARPQGYPLRGRPVEETEARVELGRKEGYDDCLRVLQTLLLAQEPRVEQPLEPDYQTT